MFDVEIIIEAIVNEGINFDKTDIKDNLTWFLFLNDSDKNGNLLRLYQQYFMLNGAATLGTEDGVNVEIHVYKHKHQK